MRRKLVHKQYVETRISNIQKEHNKLIKNVISHSPKYKIFSQYVQKDVENSYLYFLFEGKYLVYVGCSFEPYARLKAHNFYFDFIRIIKAKTEIAQKWEMLLIERLKPIYNKQGIKTQQIYIENRKKRGQIVNYRLRPLPIFPKVNIELKRSPKPKCTFYDGGHRYTIITKEHKLKKDQYITFPTEEI
tara:strand:+ start:37 stop:600 length:564 start_codon:yes stop_codon:yes gene_type:complete